MSQETRRRLAARERLDPRSDLPQKLRIGRFSHGLERSGGDRLRVGRFSTGGERLPADDPSKAGIGRFDRTQDRRPAEDPDGLRVGGYADSFAR
jgi:hypothetical protein